MSEHKDVSFLEKKGGRGGCTDRLFVTVVKLNHYENISMQPAIDQLALLRQ